MDVGEKMAKMGFGTTGTCLLSGDVSVECV